MHPKQEEIEHAMRLLCNDLDDHLEDRFGDRYPRHPNRPARGRTASVAYDGLFSTGTQFTLGYGSEKGRGYLVQVDIRTLSHVKEQDRKEIEEEAVRYIQAILPTYLPGRDISLVHDGKVIKLIGDFSLGDV